MMDRTEMEKSDDNDAVVDQGRGYHVDAAGGLPAVLHADHAQVVQLPIFLLVRGDDRLASVGTQWTAERSGSIAINSSSCRSTGVNPAQTATVPTLYNCAFTLALRAPPSARLILTAYWTRETRSLLI